MKLDHGVASRLNCLSNLKQLATTGGRLLGRHTARVDPFGEDVPNDELAGGLIPPRADWVATSRRDEGLGEDRKTISSNRVPPLPYVELFFNASTITAFLRPTRLAVWSIKYERMFQSETKKSVWSSTDLKTRSGCLSSRLEVIVSAAR